MLYSYDECIKKYGSNNKLIKALKNKKVFKIEKGIYSNEDTVMDFEIIIKKYPKAIFTMDYAFHYHGLTDSIPDKYHIATLRSARQIRDSRIKQIFIPDNLLSFGVIEEKRNNIKFKIYDKERMLIELIRYKNSLPFDYYKEIINNYRNIIHKLDIKRIVEYTELFPKSKMLFETIQKEVL